MSFLSHFAAETAAAEADIFTALGIDWRLLILQIVAFLILVFLLGKFVYPWLMKSVDERQASIEAAAKAAKKAQEAAEENQAAVAKLLETAQREAAEIVGTAKAESAELLSASEKKAKSSAERIVSEAKAQLDKDVVAARAQLHDDMLELIALTTEKVVGGSMDKKLNKELIARSLRESK